MAADLGQYVTQPIAGWANELTVPAAYPEQKSVRNVRAHREMVIHIERIGFFALGRTVMNDAGSGISRFSRNICNKLAVDKTCAPRVETFSVSD